MKKAKIMLSAIGLLSVIGGAVAFKVQHRTAGYFCTTRYGQVANLSTYTTTGGNIKLYCSTVLNDHAYSYFTKAAIDK